MSILTCIEALSPNQMIATCRRNISQHCWVQHVCAFGHHVAMCCDMLGVVGSNLTIFKFEPTTFNMLQHVTTRWPNACTCCAQQCCAQQCCDMLCWHVAIIWPGLYSLARNLQMVYQGFQIFCSVDPSQNFQARKEPLKNKDITTISSTVIHRDSNMKKLQQFYRSHPP